MRCEEARLEYPSGGTEEHVAGCPECRVWLADVRRARDSLVRGLAPPPASLTRQVMAVTVDERPASARPTPGGRTGRGGGRRLLSRALTVAAALALVAGAAGVWLVRTSGQPALASAAEATAEADSARFTFEGRFSAEVDLPANLRSQLEELGIPLPQDEIAAPPAEIPPEVRDWIERLGGESRFARALEQGVFPSGLLEGSSLRVSGEGALAGPDRVRIAGDVTVTEPFPAEGAFELVRVGDDFFLGMGEASAPTLMHRIPFRVLRPVGAGLARLTDWIGDEASGAERLGLETLDGVETERFRIDLSGEGTVFRADVWIGTEDDLVYRILIVHRTDGVFASATGRLDIRLFDHGEDVDVQVPPRAEADNAVLPSALLARFYELDVLFGPGLPGP